MICLTISINGCVSYPEPSTFSEGTGGRTRRSRGTVRPPAGSILGVIHPATTTSSPLHGGVTRRITSYREYKRDVTSAPKLQVDQNLQAAYARLLARHLGYTLPLGSARRGPGSGGSPELLGNLGDLGPRPGDLQGNSQYFRVIALLKLRYELQLTLDKLESLKNLTRPPPPVYTRYTNSEPDVTTAATTASTTAQATTVTDIHRTSPTTLESYPKTRRITLLNALSEPPPSPSSTAHPPQRYQQQASTTSETYVSAMQTLAHEDQDTDGIKDKVHVEKTGDYVDHKPPVAEQDPVMNIQELEYPEVVSLILTAYETVKKHVEYETNFKRNGPLDGTADTYVRATYGQPAHLHESGQEAVGPGRSHDAQSYSTSTDHVNIQCPDHQHRIPFPGGRKEFPYPGRAVFLSKSPGIWVQKAAVRNAQLTSVILCNTENIIMI